MQNAPTVQWGFPQRARNRYGSAVQYRMSGVDSYPDARKGKGSNTAIAVPADISPGWMDGWMDGEFNLASREPAEKAPSPGT